MKGVVAIIRTERILFLKEQLSQIGIFAMTIGDITACAEKKFALLRRGIPVSYSLIHRVKIEIFIRDDQVDQVIKAIIDTRTGKQEDGMITLSSLEQIINFSNLQKNEDALS
jgi:nitrogen regulatory protein P-II 1